MRVVFAGSAEFSLPSLEALQRSRHRLELVLTAPSRPGSRGLPAPRPVLERARQLGLPVAQPERLDLDSWKRLSEAARADILLVAAFGLLIPEAVLQTLPRGGVGVHPSLLPRHRGASPVAGAILAGDSMTGVSIFRIERRLDAGPVLGQQPVPLGPLAETRSLTALLAELGAHLLVQSLDRMERGQLPEQPQAEESASYSPKLSRADGELNWSMSAAEIDRRVRALQPWPGTSIPLAGARVKLLRGRPAAPEQLAQAEPGDVVGASGDEVLVATGEGSYWCAEVQPPGGRAVPATTYLRGRHVKIARL